MRLRVRPDFDFEADSDFHAGGVSLRAATQRYKPGIPTENLAEAARRLREIGGRVINWLTHAVLLGHYRDTQCGLKAFSAGAGKFIFERSRIDRFAFDVEVFVIAERNDLSLTEIPVTVANTTRSTVLVVRDTVRLVRDLFRIRRWSRRGAYG